MFFIKKSLLFLSFKIDGKMILILLLYVSKNLNDSVKYKKMLIFVSFIFNEDFGKINFKNTDLLKGINRHKKSDFLN